LVVYIFYIAEDIGYMTRIQELAKQVETCGITVKFFENMTQEEITEALTNVSCQLVVPSHFESFSYVLYDNLGFQYKPIVFFVNPLVEELLEDDLCIHTENCFSNYLFKKEALQNHEKIKDFADSMYKSNNSKTLTFIMNEGSSLGHNPI